MKNLKVSSKLLKVLSMVFFVVGIVYIVLMTKSFITTITSYTSQGYSFSDVFWYLFDAQFLPNVVQPAAIFGGFGVIFIALANIKDGNVEPVKAVKEEKKEATPVVEEKVAEETKEGTLKVNVKLFDSISYVGSEGKTTSTLDNITNVK